MQPMTRADHLLLSIASQGVSVYAEFMDQSEIIAKRISKTGRRALMIGVALGLTLGIIIGFIIGTYVADQVILIPLGDGIKT